MRSRGTYRQVSHPVVANTHFCQRGGRPKVVQVVDDDNDLEIEFVKEKPKPLLTNFKKLKTSPKLVTKPIPTLTPKPMTTVITIDSDDELEEMAVVTSDSDYSSASISTAEIIEEEKPASISLSVQKCHNCRRALPDSHYEYDRLTSSDFYINPRAHPSVIPLEIRDKNRFNTFSEAIRHNKELFKNKIVLVLGSGNGLLALMVCQASPNYVIVYDRPGISQIVESIIEKNRLKFPNKKTRFFIVRDDMDRMHLPNGLKKVDIIVSDWTNHSLFYKSMIVEFIKARDRFLAPGGLIFPDTAKLYLAAAHDNVHKHTTKRKNFSESFYVKRVDYWDKNVYGFDMRAIRNKVLSEPAHEYLCRSQLVTNEFLLKSFDLYHITRKDIKFRIPFELTATKSHYLQTFALFFDIVFTRSGASDEYSTRVSFLKTMFRPTIFFIDFDKHLALEKNDRIKGRFKYELSNPGLSHMSVGIDFEVKNKYHDAKEKLVFCTD